MGKKYVGIWLKLIKAGHENLEEEPIEARLKCSLIDSTGKKYSPQGN